MKIIDVVCYYMYAFINDKLTSCSFRLHEVFKRSFLWKEKN